jgi:non-specific serine/threonine protein kinase
LEASNQLSADPVDGLVEYLADRRLLMVLDNCEHLLDSCAELVDRLLGVAPGLRILATSRSGLGLPDERRCDVAPLRVPEPDEAADTNLRQPGVRLFAERAAAVSPGFQVTVENAALVGQICQRLDGIPLAIELAAARLRALPLGQLAAGLDDRFRLLTTGNRAALPRQQTLHAAVAWSFDLCTESEQQMWVDASVFAGRFDLSAATAVCAGDTKPSPEVARALRGLVDKSVLIAKDTAGETRYRMLETVREYGLTELRAADGDSARSEELTLRRRHRDFHLDLAERFDADWFGPRQSWWCDRMHAILPDLRAAFMFCLSTPGEAAAGQRLAGALFYFWYGCGETREGRHWLERVLAAEPVGTHHRMRALAAYSRLLNLLGQPTSAINPANECLEYARLVGDAFFESHALQTLGLGWLYSDNTRGLAALEEAVKRAASLPARHPAQAFTSLAFGVGMLFAGDPTHARELLAESAAICREHGEKWWLSLTLGTAVLPLLRLGDVTLANEYAWECLRATLDLRDTLGLTLSVEVMAWLAVRAKDFVRAARLLGATENQWRIVGGSPLKFGDWRQQHDESVVQIREALGDEEFDLEFQRGLQPGLDDVVEYLLGEGREPATTSPDLGDSPQLTPREREVAGLVAQGLSNRQIAQQLVISHRTAASHVSNILAKFGFSSRARVAAWFAEGVERAQAE